MIDRMRPIEKGDRAAAGRVVGLREPGIAVGFMGVRLFLAQSNLTLAIWRCSADFRRDRAMSKTKPVYRRNMDDAPRQVAVMARTFAVGHTIPLHIHRRGQLLHAVSGIMRVETAEAAWIVPPARALWLPPQWPHSVTMRSHIEMRTVYIDAVGCRVAAAAAGAGGDFRPAARADPGAAGRAGRLRRKRPRRHRRAADADRTRPAAGTPSGGADAARPARAAGRPRSAWTIPASTSTSTAGPTRPAPAGARWRASSAATPGSALPNGGRGCAPSTASRACRTAPRWRRPRPRSAMPARAHSPP